MTPLSLTLFSSVWVAGLYLFNSLIARQIKRIAIKPALLYITTLAMVGVYGETIFGSLYHFLFGHAL